jgi:hypothetical protein
MRVANRAFPLATAASHNFSRDIAAETLLEETGGRVAVEHKRLIQINFHIFLLNPGTLSGSCCRVRGVLFAHDFVALTCQTARMTALTRLVVNEKDIPSARHPKPVRVQD